MAVLDTDASEIVIRLVYDGPPEAGKTTSLRALAGSLVQPSYTPAEDADGRTLWFDWMEYTGGRFEGCQIRCQVVSVPGQQSLSARRRHLIQGADVVVFVGDSRIREIPRTLAYLSELRGMLAGISEAPVGVILQANKRDLSDAIPIDELRRAVAETGSPIGIVESVAADGTGIREAFVYAVRLALDRVRDLTTRGALRATSVGHRGADELLEALRAGDSTTAAPPAIIERGPTSPAAELLREILAHEHAASAPVAMSHPATSHLDAPRPPDTAVPSGAIWPPVEGRAILHELAQLVLVPRRLSSGDWATGLGTGWRIVSSRDALFASLDHGRTALIHWARLHAGALGAISPHRCIVLADDGDRGWRLWQIVRTETSARDALERAFDEHAGAPLIFQLARIAHMLLDAYDKLGRLPCPVPCNLDAVGLSDTGGVFIGLMPDLIPELVPDPDSGATAAVAAEPSPRSDPRVLLRVQLEAAIGADLHARGVSLDDVLRHLPGRFQQAESIAQAITAMLGA